MYFLKLLSTVEAQLPLAWKNTTKTTSPKLGFFSEIKCSQACKASKEFTEFLIVVVLFVVLLIEVVSLLYNVRSPSPLYWWLDFLSEDLGRGLLMHTTGTMTKGNVW